MKRFPSRIDTSRFGVTGVFKQWRNFDCFALTHTLERRATDLLYYPKHLRRVGDQWRWSAIFFFFFFLSTRTTSNVHTSTRKSRSRLNELFDKRGEEEGGGVVNVISKISYLDDWLRYRHRNDGKQRSFRLSFIFLACTSPFE